MKLNWKLSILAGAAMACAALVYAADDPSITTGYPQGNDNELQVQKRIAYSWANYVNGIGATNDVRLTSLTSTNSVTTGTLNVNSNASIAQRFVTPLTTLTLTNNTNYDLAISGKSSVFKVSGPTGAFMIAGFVAGNDGDRITVINTVAQNMTALHEEVDHSTTNYQILTLTGADVSTTAAGAFELIYSTNAGRWILINTQP